MGISNGGGITPKSDHLKLLSGTLKPAKPSSTITPSDAGVLRALLEAPPMPDWIINPRAIAEWNRLAPILVANKLLSEGGVTVAAVLCCITGDMQDMYANGEQPHAAMVQQYRSLTADFGLTPKSQMSVKAFGKDESVNPFTNNGPERTRRTSSRDILASRATRGV